MKKITRILTRTIAFAAACAVPFFAAGCGEKNITVVARESGSGTRSAFDEIVRDENGNTLAKDSSGVSRDAVTKTALLFNATGDVKTKVSQVVSSIGYISYGAFDSSVKALKVENVEPSAQTVKDGSYKLQRPFVILSSSKCEQTAAAADFTAYLKSATAQSIVSQNKYVSVSESAEYVAPKAELSGSVIIKGSTSVEPLMTKLIADYKVIGGLMVKSIEFSMDAQGSSQGLSAVKEDKEGNVIGMSSAAIKQTDKQYFSYFNVALDAIAVVVNLSNTIDNITISQLYAIYTGAITKFSQLSK